MSTLTYKPQNVCSKQFDIEYEDGIIKSVRIIGGCPGNTVGVSRLLEGMKIEDAIKILEGIPCRGSRTGTTSCPDQIAKALKTI